MKKKLVNISGILHLAAFLAVFFFFIAAVSCDNKVSVNTLWTFKKYPGFSIRETGFTYVLDSAERPHMVYHSGNSMDYAHWTGSEWVIEKIANDEYRGEYTVCLALDRVGNPHVVYESSGYKEVKYARRIGGKWRVDLIEHDGTALSLTLQGKLIPHMSMISRTDGYVKHINLTNDKPQVTLIQYAAYHSNKDEYLRGIRTSLCFDNDGVPHMTYTNYHDSKVMYTYRPNDQWLAPQEVDGGGKYMGLYPRIAVDKANTAHVVYADMDKNAIKYAYKLPSKWHSQVIDNRGGLATDLIMNMKNVPSSAYFGSGFRDLRFSAATMWSPEIVEDRKSLVKSKIPPGDPVTSIDQRGRPHILYYDFHRKQLCHFHRM